MTSVRCGEFLVSASGVGLSDADSQDVVWVPSGCRAASGWLVWSAPTRPTAGRPRRRRQGGGTGKGAFRVLADKAYSHPSTRQQLPLCARRIPHIIPERTDQQNRRKAKGS